MKTFEETIEELKKYGIDIADNRMHFGFGENSESILRETMTKLLKMRGEEFQWCEEYKHLTEWLTNNQKRGLFLFGDCGRGKSLFAKKAVPVIFYQQAGRIVPTYNAIGIKADEVEEIAKKPIFVIDDMGAETPSVDYGKTRDLIPEILDLSEKRGSIVILTSNLSAEQLTKRYDERTLERIKSLTKRVKFVGKSFRK